MPPPLVARFGAPSPTRTASGLRKLVAVLALLLLPAALLTGCSPGAESDAVGADAKDSTVSDNADVPTLVIENPNGTASSLMEGGPGAVAMPAGMPGCPSSTILLAWAELPNGWVLVCGYTTDQPTLWVSSIDGVETRTESVHYFAATDSSTQAGGPAYFSSTAEGSSQLSFSPATLRSEDTFGSIQFQSSVLMIYFVDLGYSAPAEGQGAFELAAPGDTAEDQVRYLAELLETSYEGRAQLQGAVAAVDDCTSAAAVRNAVDEIAAVRDNRAYLLSALASAPVDQVPEGVMLLNELVGALQHSYDADVGYLQWAEKVRDQGCNSGSAEAGNHSSGLARPQKVAFSERWNRVIYPDFAVQSIDPGKL